MWLECRSYEPFSLWKESDNQLFHSPPSGLSPLKPSFPLSPTYPHSLLSSFLNDGYAF